MDDESARESQSDRSVAGAGVQFLRGRRAIGSILVGVALVVGVLLLLRSCGEEQPQSVTIVAAGDMGCARGSRDRQRP